MKIGEFAKAVGTRISILRHYDREGLLRPIFVDKFTGYRYYDECQAEQYKQIHELKEAGFTLNEIKEIISNNTEIENIFIRKKAEPEQTIHNLQRVKNKMTELNLKEIELKPINENIDLPFINDEKIIGKWEIVSSDNIQIGGKKRELYFLPNGEEYRCYSWTKGKLLFNDGYNTFVNDYALEEHSDGLYMVIRFKSYDYVKSGKFTPVVLKQIDNRHYTKNEIARKDNINLPFRNDEIIIGKWKAVDFIATKEEFSTTRRKNNLYFKEVTFFGGGKCSVLFDNEIISENEQICRTKGYMLKKWNHTACAYEIRNIDDTDYLIMEWKSGDYRWGGMDTDYYVFMRT